MIMRLVTTVQMVMPCTLQVLSIIEMLPTSTATLLLVTT